MASMEEILKDHTDQDRASFDELSKELKALRKEVQEMRNEFARYKGFIGGVAFVISGIVTAVGLVIAWVK